MLWARKQQCSSMHKLSLVVNAASEAVVLGMIVLEQQIHCSNYTARGLTVRLTPGKQ